MKNKKKDLSKGIVRVAVGLSHGVKMTVTVKTLSEEIWAQAGVARICAVSTGFHNRS